MEARRIGAPALIALGGFPGAGKSTQAKRLATEMRVPRLSADMLGRVIRTSKALEDTAVNAHWIAYDVVFDLCAEFLQSGVSVILDLNLGHAFQWWRLDSLRQHCPTVLWMPILLQCSREVCMERIRSRHVADPDMYSPPDIYTSIPHIVNVWRFLEQLDRPDAYVVDAERPHDEVYTDIKQYVTLRYNGR